MNDNFDTQLRVRWRCSNIEWSSSATSLRESTSDPISHAMSTRTGIHFGLGCNAFPLNHTPDDDRYVLQMNCKKKEREDGERKSRAGLRTRHLYNLELLTVISWSTGVQRRDTKSATLGPALGVPNRKCIRISCPRGRTIYVSRCRRYISFFSHRFALLVPVPAGTSIRSEFLFSSPRDMSSDWRKSRTKISLPNFSNGAPHHPITDD